MTDRPRPGGLLRRQMAPLLTDLSTAQRALKQSNEAFDAAFAAISETLTAVRLANRAHGDAIDAIIAATDKALQLVQGRAR